MFNPTPGKHHVPITALLLCGLWTLTGFVQNGHSDDATPTTTQTLSTTSSVPADAPPMFDITYTWGFQQTPGVFHFHPVTTPDGQQTWTGLPNAQVKTPDSTTFGKQDPHLPNLVIIPANPPVITYDLSEDGTLTQR